MTRPVGPIDGFSVMERGTEPILLLTGLLECASPPLKSQDGGVCGAFDIHLAGISVQCGGILNARGSTSLNVQDFHASSHTEDSDPHSWNHKECTEVS